ncbi:hypothetical protein EVJ58_g3674 [Rhodofomes roseus]|uniref:Uncharacterized protein n=1 Tax=Rhodofomes roseus TaxID=34475 RepID=A0A4Y9YNY4_9APHY|nr:hypothetical protein EVJ58_g3674 [Rhodofomes roseus]
MVLVVPMTSSLVSPTSASFVLNADFISDTEGWQVIPGDTHRCLANVLACTPSSQRALHADPTRAYCTLPPSHVPSRRRLLRHPPAMAQVRHGHPPHAAEGDGLERPRQDASPVSAGPPQFMAELCGIGQAARAMEARKDGKEGSAQPEGRMEPQEHGHAL